MELRTTREMRRSEQLSKVLSKQTEGSEAPAQAQPAPKAQTASSDKLSISAQALAFLERQNQLAWEREQRRQSRMDDSLSALESSKNELDEMAEKLKVQDKCQKIAASIMKGDRVPPEDIQYLMNNDPDGYKLAMAMRREKPDPEDCKSVLDEEDKNGAAQETGGGEEPSVQSAETSGGGDAAPAQE